MFEYIRGKLVSAAPTKAVVEANGIGYSIGIALNTFTRLPNLGKEVQFFLSPVVREDAHLLYGFLEPQERNLFEQLRSVSGIGPKTAMALIGHLELPDLQAAILHGNATLLSKVPGIGKKTAERLIVDLRDKMEKGTFLAPLASMGMLGDAINALTNLGYNPLQAQKAVKKVLEIEKEPDLGKLISLALQQI